MIAHQFFTGRPTDNLQACRGKALDHGVTRVESETDFTDAGGIAEETGDDETSIPVEADYFIGFSTVEGKTAK